MKEARCATPETDLLIAEIAKLDATEATLRSVTDFHPTGSLRMSIPFRQGCAYSFSKGKCISCRPFYILHFKCGNSINNFFGIYKCYKKS